jgi:CheY-like chemotaxis protein
VAETGRVLVVDDTPANIKLLDAVLSSQGYTVVPAESGTEALSLAEQDAPDIVLLDILMPGMDGVKVLRAIRALDPSIPVVMVTANVDEKVARDTLTMGAFDYVPKPFNFHVLDRIVMAAVAAGSDGAWSPFGVNRAKPRARTLTAEQVAALVRNGTSEETAVAQLHVAN